MTRAALIIAGALAGGAAWYLSQQDAAAGDSAAADPGAEGDILGEAAQAASDFVWQTTGLNFMGDWIKDLNTRGAPYKAALQQAEDRNGIPQGMLARLAWQESRFRADIISGQTVSSAGALGIMQIVPKWHPDVNPLDPAAAINYSARYLKSLFDQFGTWELALQAYNWGPGNLKKYLAGSIGRLPTETANYSRQILADLGAGAVA